jgi:hypothetical protein
MEHQVPHYVLTDRAARGRHGASSGEGGNDGEEFGCESLNMQLRILKDEDAGEG